MSQSIPRNLKGFRDFLPADKRARDLIEGRIAQAFSRFGFDPIETPTIEYAELIMGKYGEDADRLVYTFEDKGGRKVALPYDQTVPSARILAQYQRELPRFFRRSAIRNVFRAENPQKGRYREFKQCDIDIFGSTSPIADAEIVACTYFAFELVGFSGVSIKINDRRLLVATLEPFATEQLDVFSIIRTIDKLDKLPEDAVITELVRKGLTDRTAHQALTDIAAAQPTDNLAAILECVGRLGVPSNGIEFAPTLARGLDYYTGAIYEVTVEGAGSGSLAGGGRYDELIGQLGGPDTPAVGIAFGFDRMVEAAVDAGLVATDGRGADVLVTIFDESTMAASLEAAAALRAGGMRCEVFPGHGKLGKQFKLADQKQIPAVLIIGPDELRERKATYRDMKTGSQSEVPLDAIVEGLRRLLNTTDG